MTLRTEWPEEHDDAIREGRANGRSFGDITKDLNKRFRTDHSRNSIIGRAHRIGVVAPQTTITNIAHQKEFRKARRRKEPRPVAELAASNAVKLPETIRMPNPLGADLARKRCEVDMPKLRCAEVEPLHLDIADLNDQTCRWPIGGWPDETPITFCGHPPVPGSPYCEEHRALGLRSSQPSLSPAKEDA